MRMTCRWKNRAMHARDFDFFGSGFIAMAHRGGAQLPENLGKENTIAAFSHAMNRGITHLETDIQVTRDGHLVTMHDPVLARVTDDDHGVVAMLTLDELREATIEGEPIPTLDEVLGTFPDACFNIDMKAPGTVEPLVATLVRHQAWDRVCVGSFNPRRLTAFRRLVDHPVATAVGPVGVASSCLTHRPTMHIPLGVVYQMPWRIKMGSREIDLVTPSFLRAAHRAGKLVQVWTINDPGQMEQLIEMGVDGIITDRPDVLLNVMRRCHVVRV